MSGSDMREAMLNAFALGDNGLFASMGGHTRPTQMGRAAMMASSTRLARAAAA